MKVDLALIQLKRSGLDGKTVFIHKFRTMHPYSEYLQQYVFERQGLEPGKIKQPGVIRIEQDPVLFEKINDDKRGIQQHKVDAHDLFPGQNPVGIRRSPVQMLFHKPVVRL
jgi:hypothetical protein